jgi:hypothetical protein
LTKLKRERDERAALLGLDDRLSQHRASVGRFGRFRHVRGDHTIGTHTAPFLRGNGFDAADRPVRVERTSVRDHDARIERERYGEQTRATGALVQRSLSLNRRDHTHGLDFLGGEPEMSMHRVGQDLSESRVVRRKPHSSEVTGTNPSRIDLGPARAYQRIEPVSSGSVQVIGTRVTINGALRIIALPGQPRRNVILRIVRVAALINTTAIAGLDLIAATANAFDHLAIPYLALVDNGAVPG